LNKFDAYSKLVLQLYKHIRLQHCPEQLLHSI